MNRQLTVAAVRGPEDGDHVEVLFLESPRIYRLARGHPDFDDVLERLRRSERDGAPVKVSFTSVESDEIEQVA